MFGVALLTSTLLALADARIYERCELARDLLDLGIRKEHIATWVCIAYHESRFDTAAQNPHSGDHGLLQISQLYWCGPGKACGKPCTAFRDEDISDDVECALQIHEEHTRLQGDGFLAWVVYPHHCKHNAKKYLADCDNSVKSSLVRTTGRARVLKPQIKNFTNNYAYYDKIDELLPPYLTIGSVVRGSYEKQFQQVFSKKPQVDWFSYKLDNIDDLQLPVFGPNFKQKVSERYSTTLSTTTTTTPSPLPNIKPPSPRRIESNSFRRRKNRPLPEPEGNVRQTTESSNDFVKNYVQKNVPHSTTVSPTLTTIRPSTINNEHPTSFGSGSTQVTASPVQTTTSIPTTTKSPAVQTTARIPTKTKNPSFQTTSRIETITRTLFTKITTKVSSTSRPPYSPIVQTTTKIHPTTRSRSVQTSTQIATTSKPSTFYVQATNRIPSPTRPPSVRTTTRILTTRRPLSDQTTRISTTTTPPFVQSTTRMPTTNIKVVTTKQHINLKESKKVNNVTLSAIQKSTTVLPSTLKGKQQTTPESVITVTEVTPTTLKPLTTANYYENSFEHKVNKSGHVLQSTTITTSKPQTRSWGTWRTSREHEIIKKTTTSQPSIINWRNVKSGLTSSPETLNKKHSTTQATKSPITTKPQSTRIWPQTTSSGLSGSNSSTTKALFDKTTTLKPKIPTGLSTSPTTTGIVTSTESPSPSTSRTTQSIFDLYLNPTKRPKPPTFSFPSFRNSGHSFKIFAGGTTTNAPFFLKKEDTKVAPGEAANNQIKRQARQTVL